MPRIFGTDGVRGLANGVITAELAVDLGVAAARVLVDHGGYTGQRPVAVVGRDTRISGQFLEHAVIAGLASAGVDVLRLRVLPTPGVAFLTESLGADLGVVISASHNPMPDNGIKFLARGGVKLDDALEHEIEAATRRGVGTPDRCRRRPGHAVRRDRRGVRRPPAQRPSTTARPGCASCSTARTVRRSRSGHVP